MKRLTAYRPLAAKGADINASQATWSWLFAGCVCAILLLPATGCRGRAQEDMYRQSLQREVRQLEDQLYEADYENRILIEKLRRERKAKPQVDELDDRGVSTSGRAADPQKLDPSYVPAQSPEFPLDDAAGSSGSSSQSPNSAREQYGSDQPLEDPGQSGATPNDSTDSLDGDDGLPDLDSLIDPGDLVEPDDLVDPGELVDPGTLVEPGTLERPIPTPEKDPAGGARQSDPTAPDSYLLPPPGGPVPPGASELDVEPIDPGTPMPPGTNDGESEDDPSKIELPGVSMLGGLGEVVGATPEIELQPARISIDAATSRVRVDAEQQAKLKNTAAPDDSADEAPPVMTEGVDLTIRANDQYGHPIAVLGRTHTPTDPLRSPDTASPRPLPDGKTRLSILALDPTKTGEDAQLGRWEFDTEKLRELETSSLAVPTSGHGITVPIRWQKKVPTGEAVVFFARLVTEKRDLRCESEIGLKKQPSVAGWLPRR
ncbi:hypothetical protein [Allorhodopirellula solitaria]|uniref:Uncharacterized protein n=1 Tax=Allorhodopirellula solitaria TaxID=2527987 RepID=A0A5C5XYF0_9BACT|nr:hypothetical protein [Allorhodopirellula solitaria]TWT67561.1 hypothetical protein CA85_24130 [Allorhodopirellula solitaria]